MHLHKIASHLNQMSNHLADLGKPRFSLRLARLAAIFDSKWSVPAYNLGLRHKYLGNWKESADWNLRAIQLAPDDEAAWWNLGIASTALRQWRTARQAWNHFGMNYEIVDEAIEDPFGKCAVRLQPFQNAEVVWVTRVDPARGQIENIPFPETGYRFGDIVLHDGAPNGQRISGGVEYPVFDCLELWATSNYGTWRLDLNNDCYDRTEEIETTLEAEGLKAQCWTTSVRLLCRECSEGIPHEHKGNEKAQGNSSPVSFGLSSTSRSIEPLVAGILSSIGITHFDLEMMLPPFQKTASN